MVKRFENYTSSAPDRKRLRRSFIASVLIHVGVLALIIFVLRGGYIGATASGYTVQFIPKGHPDGAIEDATAQAVAAPPPKTVEQTPPAPPKPPEPEPKPKPKKEVKPVKPPEKPKVEEKAPPKPKPVEKPKEKPKAPPKKKPKEIAKSKEKPHKAEERKLAKVEKRTLPKADKTKGKETSSANPQQGKADGEEKTGVSMQQGLPGILGYWGNLVQRKIEMKWRTPEGVLIVPGKNSALITFFVDRKGELVGEPEVIQDANDPAVAKSGIKAILDAAPYPPLPDEYKGNEQQVMITFSLAK